MSQRPTIRDTSVNPIGGAVTGHSPLPTIIGHQQVIQPGGRIMCEPIYQRPTTRVESEYYPPLDGNFPDIGGRR